MIIFRNNGCIDINAAVTLGVSVKEEGSIGYFGTGLKFAIATVLRNGGTVSIQSGHDRYKFETLPVEIRGKPFDFVTMNGTQIGFTTQLGRDWKAWMAFRELASNARDEGGSFEAMDSEPTAGPDETIIAVKGGGIEDAFEQRHTIFLLDEPLEENDSVAVHSGETNFVYYRGVRIGQLPRTAQYRYNIKSQIELTEDRTPKWSFQISDAVAKGITQLCDKDRIAQILNRGEKWYEHHIDLPDHGQQTPQFLEASAALRADLDNVMNANPSAMTMAKNRRLSQLGPQQSVALDDIEATRFKVAKQFLISAGYAVDDYDIVIVDDLGPGVYGLAKEEKIFIAKAAFQRGTKEVASTLLEEYAHLKTSYGDMTRGLQTWLFDEVITQAEKAAGQGL